MSAEDLLDSSSDEEAGEKPEIREFRDPDYPDPPGCDLDEPSSSANDREFGARLKLLIENAQSANCAELPATGEAPTAAVKKDRLEILQDVLQRVLNEEFERNNQSLNNVTNMMETVLKQIHKLRCLIVQKHMRDQELSVKEERAREIRGQTLFDNEPHGVQMQLHPSVRKIVGKKPTTLDELLRPAPRRAAAKNAVKTIRASTQVEKRRQRQLQKKIRAEGIVIDHSKSESQSQHTTSGGSTLKSAPTSTITSSQCSSIEPTPTALNSSRLNNKVQYLIAVGNSSQYIGGDAPSVQRLTYKWLVFLRGYKNSDLPIEKVVSKVRFILDSSYAPNHIVDVNSPPFQLVRLGWGEFPIHIKLFFHKHFEQNPLTVEHQLVLDKKRSGAHVLNSETVLAIWLRASLLQQSTPKPAATAMKLKAEAAKSLVSLQDDNYVNSDEEDEDLIEFLNKLETSNRSSEAPFYDINKTVVHLTKEENEVDGVMCDIKKLAPDVEPRSLLKQKSRPQLNVDRIKATKPKLFTLDTNILSSNKNTTISSPSSMLVQKLKRTHSSLSDVKYDKGAKVKLGQQQQQVDYTKSAEPEADPTSPKKMGKLPKREKQISLLKSRPNKQRELQQQFWENIKFSIENEHDYPCVQINVVNKLLTNANGTATTGTATTATASTGTATTGTASPNVAHLPIHLRIPNLNPENFEASFERPLTLQEKLHKNFAMTFSKMKFTNTRGAVEYLLTHIPVVRNSKSPGLIYEFTQPTLEHFVKLPAFKQRSLVWLRAKRVEGLLHTNQYLQNMWSTAEIIEFARSYGYTPSIKGCTLETRHRERFPGISTLLDKQDTSSSLDTLTPNTNINCWVDKMSAKVAEYEREDDDNAIIDIEGDASQDKTAVARRTNVENSQKMAAAAYLPPPLHLKHEMELVNHICQEREINLQPEQIIENVVHPSAKVVYAQALHMFLGRLIRGAAAENMQRVDRATDINIETKDIIAAISRNPDMDFLTNKNMGAFVLKQDVVEVDKADK